jgi:acyl-CoA thioester hydrolase
MFVHQTTLRVRYAETDQMGYVYYGQYATYYEVARVEALRSLGITYKVLEEEGTIIPVAENYSKYMRPARYDDVIEIKAMVNEMPGRRIVFHYELFVGEQLINTGWTSLAFVDRHTGKPGLAPDSIMALLKPHFNE